MKIMIVTPYFYPKIGGLENYALAAAKGLQQQGHEVFIVTSNHESKTRVEEKAQGLAVIRLPRLFKLSNTPINLAWHWQLKKIIKTEKPDIINAHTPVPFIADMTERVRGQTPFVVTYHNDLIKSSPFANLLAKTYNALFTRKTLHQSDMIIVTSKYYADKSKYLRKLQAKVKVVSPGLDTQKLHKKVDKTWLHKKYSHKKIVLFVGSMDKSHAHKGVDVLIRAIAEARVSIPNIHLIAAGESKDISVYKSLSHKLGIGDDVSFPGFISDNELPLYYAGADVLVLPSINDSEGFGMVLIEAQACGTMVIGTNVGGIPHALKDKKTGYLVPPNNPFKLAEKINLALSDGDLSNRMGVAASVFALKNFSLSEFSITYEHIMQQATKPVIVQVIPHYPPYIGGMELRVQDLSNKLIAKEYRVLVLTSNQKTYAHTTKLPDEPMVQYLRSVERASTTIIPSLFFKILKLPRRSILHVHIASAFGPEVSFIAAKLRKLPYIAHIRLDVKQSGPLGFLLSPYKKFILGPVLRRADHIIVLNLDYKNLAVDKYRVDPRKVAIIPNATDFPIVTNYKNILHQPLRLLLVGRLSHQKNIPLLLNAAQALKQQGLHLSIKIVGDGDDRDKLQKLTEELGIQKNIKFEGRLEGADLIRAYNWTDMVVQTSSEEAFSTVLIEALALAKPLIATDIIGTRSIIKDKKTGLLVDPYNVESLEDAIKLLLESPKLRNQLVSNASIEVKKYKWDKIVNRTEELYQEVQNG